MQVTASTQKFQSDLKKKRDQNDKMIPAEERDKITALHKNELINCQAEAEKAFPREELVKWIVVTEFHAGKEVLVFTLGDMTIQIQKGVATVISSTLAE